MTGSYDALENFIDLKQCSKHWAGSVDRAVERKRMLASGVLGEAASSLPTGMLTLSADNIKISKNKYIGQYNSTASVKKATNFYAQNLRQTAQSQQPAL